MTKRRRPAAIEALSRQAGVGRLTDENLQDLHDMTLIALVRCQYELQRRGTPSSVLVQRVENISQFATDGGKPPLCRHGEAQS